MLKLEYLQTQEAHHFSGKSFSCWTVDPGLPSKLLLSSPLGKLTEYLSPWP